jgi:uncharacterized protein
MTTKSALPAFRYHSNPVVTGSVVASDTVCLCCGLTRGYVYVGGVYGAKTEDLDKALCPWCIADGTASSKFEVVFVDSDGSEPVDSPESSEELATRTPGYIGWQGPYWTAHCGDYCDLIAVVGGEELRGLGDEVLKELEADLLQHFRRQGDAFEVLTKDGWAMGYLFRCLKCRRHRLHVDFS